MNEQSRVFKIAVATGDVEGFLAACEEAQWYAYDTGERVMTEDGPEGEAVLLVEPMAETAHPKDARVLQTA